MISTNFMVQDIFSTLIGFLLFPLLLILPGYIVGRILNTFSFRSQHIYSQVSLSLLLSFAVSPILFYLLSSLVGFAGTQIFVYLLLLFAVALFLRDLPDLSFAWDKKQWYVVIYAVVWIVFSLFSLVDIQIKDGLYYTVAGFDHATRISIVDAMTRTGVPPVNPSYYPGKPVILNFLYFFWYILGGFVDYLGRSLVDARGAFFSSVIWAGLGLMAAISTYLRLRNTSEQINKWAVSLTGIALIAVTGLDIFPVILVMSNLRAPIPDAEHWNEQISSWMSSLLWVPHHLAALVVGIVILMLLIVMRNGTKKEQFIYMTIGGIAFASAFGLSVWVTLVLVLFWVFCLIQDVFYNRDREYIVPMLYAGILALILSAGFLAGILSGIGTVSSGVNGVLPIKFDVRAFTFLDIATEGFSNFLRSILRLLLLPLNYFLEFGFYFVAAIIWFRKRKKEYGLMPFRFEITLLLSSFLVGTFIRSTLIENNDLGWRSWLLGQFVLLIWGVDVFSQFWITLSVRTRLNLGFLLFFGVLSTIVNVGLLRLEPILAGPEFGERNLSARKAYTSINEKLPETVVVQYNPDGYVNRPSGLYGMRQSAISARTAYGISESTFINRVDEIKVLFYMQNITSWQPIDNLCRKFYIDILVIENNDPLWRHLDVLSSSRNPYYIDDYYAVFACGDFASAGFR